MKSLKRLWTSGCLGKLAILIAGLVACGLLTVGLGALLPDTTAQSPSEERQEPTPTLVLPTEAPLPTNTAVPTEVVEPAEALYFAIEENLGSSNRDIPRLEPLEITNNESMDGAIITIRWTINDNLTDDLIVYGAQKDASNILRLVDESEIRFQRVVLRGTFPLVDVYGNVEEVEVVRLFFEPSAYEQINWDNFLFENIYRVAYDVKTHPIFTD